MGGGIASGSSLEGQPVSSSLEIFLTVQMEQLEYQTSVRVATGKTAAVGRPEVAGVQVKKRDGLLMLRLTRR